jgi:hypothetical protein
MSNSNLGIRKDRFPGKLTQGLAVYDGCGFLPGKHRSPNSPFAEILVGRTNCPAQFEYWQLREFAAGGSQKLFGKSRKRS